MPSGPGETTGIPSLWQPVMEREQPVIDACSTFGCRIHEAEKREPLALHVVERKAQSLEKLDLWADHS